MFNCILFENRAVCEIMWGKNCRGDKPQKTVRGGRIACWIHIATHTHTHSDCVMWENIIQPDRPQIDNKVHAFGKVDTSGYKHTLAVCNAHCFSTATMVARTRLNIVIYIHCLSLLRNKTLDSGICKTVARLELTFRLSSLYASAFLF